MKKIGQRQAARYLRRVRELEHQINRQKNAFASDFGPGWVNIATLTLNDPAYSAIKTARLLGHAVVCVPSGSQTVYLYASKL
jgi:hypothetical protein